jgi:hypothetical protein
MVTGLRLKTGRGSYNVLLAEDLTARIVYDRHIIEEVPEPRTCLVFAAGMGIVLRKTRFGCGFAKG